MVGDVREPVAVLAQRIVLPVDETIGAEAEALYVRGDAQRLSRRSVRVSAGGAASFATYFNAFPMGVWATTSEFLGLSLRFTTNRVAQHRLIGITAAGEMRTLDTSNAVGEVVLTMDFHEDIAWAWLETVAGAEPVTIRDGEWHWQTNRSRSVRIVVSITTMNRTEDCTLLVEALGDAELRGEVDEVLVIDQGSDAIASQLRADRLPNDVLMRVIEQENLGGSGGFSRGMIEALNGSATHVLLLDDDVRIEPESIRRLRALAVVAVDEPLLGAQMLSMIEPTVLHSMGEQIDRRTMWWRSTEPTLSPANLASRTIERTPELRRFRAVDFNGWWMCLIPLQVVRTIGASLPYFIKWDDAEYGLRAAEAGHRTVTLPGTALWHVPWTSKDDGLDWQAYFQLRNRLVTALIHSKRPRRVLSATWLQDVNHLLCLQYGSVEVRIAALRAVLAGPERLIPTLRTARADSQQLLRKAGQIPVDGVDGAVVSSPVTRPRGALQMFTRLVRVLAHQARRTPPTGSAFIRVPRSGGKWWLLGVSDHVALESASGRGVFQLRRSRRVAFRLLWTSVELRIRIWFGWQRIARQFRDAAPKMASPTSWGRVYGADFSTE